MAATKTTRPAAARNTTNRKSPARKTATPTAKTNESLTTKATKAVKARPKTSAAVATGALAAVAAAGAAYFFTKTETGKKAGKDIKAKASRIKTRAKAGAADLREKAGEVSDKVKDGLSETGNKFKDAASRVRVRDGVDDKTQTEIAEEALTLKETGRKTRKPVDPVVEQQAKAGAISY